MKNDKTGYSHKAKVKQLSKSGIKRQNLLSCNIKQIATTGADVKCQRRKDCLFKGSELGDMGLKKKTCGWRGRPLASKKKKINEHQPQSPALESWLRELSAPGQYHGAGDGEEE